MLSPSAASSWDTPRPHVHPRSGREPRIHPHSAWAWKVLPRPNGNGFWITHHLAGLSAPLPLSITGESQEGSGLSLEFRDDLVKSWLQSVCGKRNVWLSFFPLTLVQWSLISGLWLDPVLKSLSSLGDFSWKTSIQTEVRLSISKAVQSPYLPLRLPGSRWGAWGASCTVLLSPLTDPPPPSHEKDRCQHSRRSDVWAKEEMEAEASVRAWGSPREAWELGCLPGGLFRLAWRTPASTTVSFTLRAPSLWTDFQSCPSGFLGPSSSCLHHHWGPRGLLTKFTHFGGPVRCSHKRANICLHLTTWQAGSPGGSVIKNSPASAGDVGSIPGPGRSPEERSGHPLQYSWEIPRTEKPGGLQSMESQSQTWSSDWTTVYF